MLILILPLTLFLVSSLLGRFLGFRGVYLTGKIILIICILISLSLFREIILDGNILTIYLLNWFNIEDIQINWIIFIDDLSLVMLIIIFSITLIVYIYSFDYLINDPHQIRFYSFINLFLLCMTLLITTTSLTIIFIAWEGIGLASFLLISFWYNRIEANLGALLSFTINRIGDVFFLLGIFLSQLILGSIDLLVINLYEFNLDIILIFFLLAAMAKSAQIYLHIWLPYSMEAPTPISALIHAATLVTAGIFLLNRLSLLISYSYYILILLSIIGSLTALLGGILAIVSLDYKELIAYSTISQLGYMVTILGLQSYSLSFFHLINHAYFKALLFLTAGSIIHSISDIQDFRKSGSLIYFLPISYFCMLIGFSSLTGLPFTTGFYSKESIINNSVFSYLYLGEFIYWITLLSALFTIYYSLNFMLKVFFKLTRLSLFALKNIHYFSLHLSISLFIITIITIFFGYICFKWIYLLNLPISFYSLELPFYIKIIPILFFFLSIILINSIFKINYNFSLLNNKFYFSNLYYRIASLFFSFSYRIFFKLMDYGYFDLIGPILGGNLIKLSRLGNKFNYMYLYFFPFFLYFLFIFLFIF